MENFHNWVNYFENIKEKWNNDVFKVFCFTIFFKELKNLHVGSRAPTMVRILKNVYLILGPTQHKLYYYKKCSNFQIYIFFESFFKKK